MLNNKTWTPEQHLNYFSRDSLQKNRRVLQPGHLISHIQTHKSSKPRKAGSLNTSARKQHFSMEILSHYQEGGSDYILIQDQQREFLEQQSFEDNLHKYGSDWISIEQIPLAPEEQARENNSTRKQQGVRFQKEQLQQQLERRRHLKKRKGSQTQNKTRKGSTARRDQIHIEQRQPQRQMVREFSFGDKVKLFPVQERKPQQQQYFSPNKMFRKLFNEEQIKKLSQSEERKDKLNLKKKRKVLNTSTPSGVKKKSPRDNQNKQKQWQNFMQNLIMNSPRKQSTDSVSSSKEQNIIKSGYRRQKKQQGLYQTPIKKQAPDIQECEDKSSGIQRVESCHKSEPFQVNRSQIQSEDTRQTEPIRPTMLIHKRSPEAHVRQEKEAERRQKQLLQAEWEQSQKSNKVNYIAKPNTFKPTGKNYNEGSQESFKIPKKLQTALLPVPSLVEDYQFHGKSLKLLSDAISASDQEFATTYQKIEQKIIESQCVNEIKLAQQNKIMSIMQCLISLTKQQMRPEDYVLSETTDSSEGKQIKMNQVILRGLIRKIGKGV